MVSNKAFSGGIGAFVFNGGLDFLFSGLLSYLTIKHMVIPIHNAYGKELTHALSERSKFFEDTDETFVFQAFGGILGYTVMSFVCTTLDIFFWTTKMTEWKVQGVKSFFSIKDWLDAYSMSITNQLIFSWAATIPSYMIQKSGVFHPNAPMSTLSDEFDLKQAVMHLAFCGLFIEVWFFTTHRALHWPPLFKAIHKKHHRFHAPTAVASMYAHPVEFVVGNVFGVVLGPALTNAHPYTAAFWLCFSLITTGGSHSGFSFFGALDHDAHHEHFDVNYGVGVFMDKLCNTCFEGSELEKKVLARKERVSKKRN